MGLFGWRFLLGRECVLMGGSGGRMGLVVESCVFWVIARGRLLFTHSFAVGLMDFSRIRASHVASTSSNTSLPYFAISKSLFFKFTLLESCRKRGTESCTYRLQLLIAQSS